MRRLVVMMIAAALLASCSDDTDAAPDPAGECTTVAPETLDFLAEGLSPDESAQLLQGVARELPAEQQEHGFRYVVAVQLDVDDLPASFAMGRLDKGPVLGLDTYARELFTWASDATDESELGQWREDAEVVRARLQAERCLG